MNGGYVRFEEYGRPLAPPSPFLAPALDSVASALGSTIAPVRIAEPEIVEDDAGGYDSGWFCIRTDPFPCPADGCAFVAMFQTAVHLIVVWPSVDDRDLLTTARNCQVAGRNPRIVPYEKGFGKAISWDAWDAAGRPIHGHLELPEGWDKLRRL